MPPARFAPRLDRALCALGLVGPLVLGCGGSAPLPCPAIPPPLATAASPRASAPSSSDSEARAAAACHEATTDLDGWLRTVADLGWPLATSLLDEGARLVERPGLALDDPAPLVHVSASALAVDGLRLSDASELAARLERLLERRQHTMESSPFLASPLVYLAIDADVRWDRLTALLPVLSHAGYERIGFVFVDRQRPMPARPASRLDDELAALSRASPGRRQRIVAQAVSYTYGECSSALQLFAELGQEIPEVEQASLAKLPGALEVCGCKADLAAVRALHWALHGNPLPGSVVLAALPPPGATATNLVAAPAELEWSASHARVVAEVEAAMAPIGFAIEPSVTTLPAPPPTSLAAPFSPRPAVPSMPAGPQKPAGPQMPAGPQKPKAPRGTERFGW